MCCKSGPTEASSNHIIVYPVLKKVHNFENTYLKTEMWWIIISQIWVCHIYIYCCLYEYKVNKLHWDSKIWETPLILSMILSNCDRFYRCAWLKWTNIWVFILFITSPLRLHALRELLFTLTCTRAFGHR